MKREKSLEIRTREIPQVIGCAYTYQGSLGIRKKLTAALKERGIHHSSQERDFSYFYKGDSETVIGVGDGLHLSGYDVDHWPEAELALVLGKNHEIVGYTLANDFTAIGIEAEGRTDEFDGTYLGKVWKGSCSLGPKIIRAEDVNVEDLDIGLRIERAGEEIYSNKYNTRRRKREFRDLLDMIVEYNKEFGDNIPPSKRIRLDNGFLVEGTVVLAGTGLIVPSRCYSKRGDAITVYSTPFGKLRNMVV
ncbi:MAG: fumarylacetoacetate hydrolase family protein [Bacteroidetes bacterium]|nr:fumarylacetoacetate hydrolase family protein [Bacteroidota bacterium]